MWPNLKGLLHIQKVTFMDVGCATNVLSPKVGSRERNERDGKCLMKRLHIFSKGGKTT